MATAQCGNHVGHSTTTWCKGSAHLLILTQLKSRGFLLLLFVCFLLVICLAPKVMKKRKKPEYNEKPTATSPLLLFVGCLTSQQYTSVSQGRICSDNLTRCHTETEVADQTFHLTQSQYTDTGPTSPSTNPITPGAWQGSHWSANFEVTGMTRPRKNPGSSGIRTRDLPLSRRTPGH